MAKKKTNKNEIKELIDHQVLGENIDASNPVYNNCVFYQIDSASFGTDGFQQNKMNNKNVQGMSAEQQEKEVEKIRGQMVDYICGITGFSPEMVERVLDQAETFMKNQFGLE